MQSAETNDPNKVRIDFTPRYGDVVEFLSDRQTEKGPSSGRVCGVDYETGICMIRHSDGDEAFTMKNVLVKKYIRRNPNNHGLPYWGLF